jgi:hypothetical protein
MSDILDKYTAHELKEIYYTPQETWPEDFLHFIHDEMANDLLNEYLETADMDEYIERAGEIVFDTIDINATEADA